MIHDVHRGASGRERVPAERTPTPAERAPVAGPVLVVGLGETGLSCIRHLAGTRGRMVAVDSRERPPRRGAVESEFPGVEIRCGRFVSLFGDAAEIVVSPGVSVREPALRPRRRAACRSPATSNSSPARPMRRSSRSPAPTGRAPSPRSSRRWRGAAEYGPEPGGTWGRRRCRCSDGAASCTCWSFRASSSRRPIPCARPRRRC